MKVTRILVLTVALLFAVACYSSAFAADDLVKASQGYGVGAWYTSIFGNMTDKFGNTVSLRNDLGQKNTTGPVVDLDWRLGDKWSAGVDFAYLKSNVSNYALPNNVVFGGKFIAAGDRITSSMKLTTTTVKIKYALASSDDGQFDIGFSPKIINVEASARAAAAGNIFAPVSKSVFIPCASLSGKQRISDRLYFYGNVDGIAYKDNSLFDVRADLRWNFQHPGWFATLGYRYYNMKIDKVSNDIQKITSTWNGPMATIRYEF